MRRAEQRPQPVKFTLRLYPDVDGDLIRWLGQFEGRHLLGAKSRAIKEALRRGIEAGREGRVAPGRAELDPVEVSRAVEEGMTSLLPEVRRVVEAAFTSALGRFEGRPAGAATATPEEEDGETEALLDALDAALVLDE
jgi:hypothetical protein